MSPKPLKKSEKKKQEELQSKLMKKRQKEIHPFPPYMYILSEGTKTEPNYVREMARQINQKYKKYTSGDIILVEGTGRNTLGLLDYAQRQVKQHSPNTQLVWLLYDKDDFPTDNFDNTQFSAESEKGIPKYRVAWSNECIELWFLLHFQEYPPDNGRDQYIEKLKEHLPGYQKNDPDIFNKLKPHTQDAIVRAKKQYHSYDDGDVPPSQRVPATRMFELVEELQQYL